MTKALFELAVERRCIAFQKLCLAFQFLEKMQRRGKLPPSDDEDDFTWYSSGSLAWTVANMTDDELQKWANMKLHNCGAQSEFHRNERRKKKTAASEEQKRRNKKANN